MTFLKVLWDSVSLVRRCWRFFIPKILVAFFFFPIFILLPYYLLEVNILSPNDIVGTDPMELMEILVHLVFILLYTFGIYVIDSFVVNPMYPILVKQFYKDKKINFRHALIDVIKRFGTIFPALVVVSLLILVALLPFLFIIVSAILLENTFLLYLALITTFFSIFVIFLFFYLIYPISSLEKVDFVKAVKDTMHSSLRHKNDIAKAFFISISISGVSYLLGFMIAWMNAPDQIMPKLGLFGVFVLVRLAIAMFSTYQYILNSVFYFGLEKGVFLGD